jgi:hypothetical protein
MSACLLAHCAGWKRVKCVAGLVVSPSSEKLYP